MERECVWIKACIQLPGTKALLTNEFPILKCCSQKSYVEYVKQVPAPWYKGNIEGLAEFLEFRLRNLHRLFRQKLQHNRRIRVDVKARFSNASMQLCNSRPLQIRPGLG